MANPGDTVKITTKDETIEGTFMPSTQEDVVIIKLDNGYNLGLKKQDIKEITVTEKVKADSAPTKTAQKTNKNLPTIVVLHTGGTIASKVEYKTGGVTAQTSAQELLSLVPELQNIANINAELVANMMSEDMQFSDYQTIAKAIQKQVKAGVDGIIIGHGTDTLGYTAAALSFMFENLPVPVILVGSQRSSDRGSSDAAMNLICAAQFIAKTEFVGVAISMHHSSSDDKCAILPATKTRKMHTSRRDAFKPINANPIALVEYKTGNVEFLEKYYSTKQSSTILLKERFSSDVALVNLYPTMDPKIFEFYTQNYGALVLEATGLGHAPTNSKENQENYKSLVNFIKSGGIVAITSQCLYGRVSPTVYTNLRRLADIGCIFCEDMLPETAYVKLSWLLGNYPKKQVPELLTQNLRGEITERIVYKEDFEQ